MTAVDAAVQSKLLGAQNVTIAYRRGRDAMTILGSVIGASAAAEGAETRVRSETRVERFCETRYEYEQRDRVEGYRVTYVLDGQTYTTRTSEDPGNRIRVRGSVQPLVD